MASMKPVPLHDRDEPILPTRQYSERILVLLTLATTVLGCWAFIVSGGALDSEEEVEIRDEVLHATIVGARVWFLVTILTGLVGAKGVLQNQLPSIRFFAIHSIIDTSLAGLTTLILGLVSFSPSVSSKLGHAVCEHISRGDSLGIVYSPGSGLEACEEKWSYSIAPLLLLLAGIALYVRTKTAIYIYYYYRAAAAAECSISLESPSMSSQPHLASSPMRKRTSTSSSGSSSSTISSHSGRHSRSSSASTVRTNSASRIMLLPADYKQSPSMSSSPFSLFSGANESSDSLNTIKAPIASSKEAYRKRSMSSDSHSSQGHRGMVIVYAPTLMSVEEAQKLGGREAVIANPTLSVSPASYSSSTASAGRYRQPSPVSTKRSTSPGTAPVILEEEPHSPGPFVSLKGYRDTTELEDLCHRKTA